MATPTLRDFHRRPVPKGVTVALVPSVLALTIRPVHLWMSLWMGETVDTPEAALLSLAAAMVESGLVEREQRRGGPARSLWMFENGPRSALAGLWGHKRLGDYARSVAATFGLGTTRTILFSRLPYCDQGACALARLLALSDPRRLPVFGDETACYSYYDDLWRPGVKRPDDWSRLYPLAAEAVRRSFAGSPVPPTTT